MSDGIVRAIVIHGVGEQPATFADFAIKHLGAALGKRRVPFFARPAYWAKLADAPEARYLKRVRAHGSEGNWMQRLAIGTLSDALYYQENEKLREGIADVLDQAYADLRADSVWVFAHSLGALAALDWMRSRPRAAIDGLVTFGCNTGLFTLGKPFDCPEQVKLPGRWVNYFYASDFLGYPLAVGDVPGFEHVRDIEVRKPFWRVSSLPFCKGLSHIDYLSDASFWSETIPSRI